MGKRITRSSQECGKSHSNGVTWRYTGGKPVFGLELSGRISRAGDNGAVRTKRSQGPAGTKA